MKRLLGWIILGTVLLGIFTGITLGMMAKGSSWWEGPVVIIITIGIAGLLVLGLKWILE